MQFIGADSKKEQLSRLWNKLLIPSCDGYEILFNEGDLLKVSKNGNVISVTYANDSQLYRSLLLAAELIADGEDREIEEKEQFERKGVMLDMSRAGVMTVDAVKEYIEYMALCGLNALMLYMEDVFEVEGLPYFGYMRGRYSKEDLKEMDAYGLKYGVELIPCIQTLGHFEQYLKWKETENMKDTPTVIMAGEEESLIFIDKLLAAVSECFTTRKIHIGMDEAWGIGTGNYLIKNGYKDGTEVFCDHLTKVKKLTDKYNFEPMIWSDMYFRLASETGYYYDENAIVKEFVKELLPEGISLTYWDYYHKEEADYELMIKKHKQLTDKIVFAGGIWLWAGTLPDYRHTLVSTNAGLNVCKREGIKDVYATMWGDDGCETDVMFSLPGCVLYGEHSYNAEISEEETDKKLMLLFGFKYSDIEDISTALYPLGKSYNQGNPSISVKQIIYNDILCGLADYEMKENDFSGLYGELAAKYEKLAENEGPLSEHLSYVAAVCRVAGLRMELVNKLHNGYEKDKALLSEAAHELLPELSVEYSKLKEIHYSLWHKSYRPFGFEIADTRYGGKIERIKTAIKRIDDYLEGRIDSLPELSEERIPFVGQMSIGGWYSGVSSAFLIKGY